MLHRERRGAPAADDLRHLIEVPDADLALRKISVLSPIGRSLLGRRRGDIVDVALPGGRLLEIHIADTARRKALREAA